MSDAPDLEFLPGEMGVYFHWPFCASKCPYCDFNAHVADNVSHERWRAAYQRAVSHYAEMLPDKRVVSIFFGGGTPSLMEPESVAAAIDAVRAGWPCSNTLEVTLEANPTSVEAAKLAAFREAGVNRVSLGVQALNDADLSFLGRAHDAAQAVHAIKISQEIFERVSFDLIYARPSQTLEGWRDELCRALDLARGHMSLYQLTIERSTPFYLRSKRGEFVMPGEAMGADFYHLTQDVTEEAGMPAYEVSNHAVAGQECRHNMIYWTGADYIGIGPGAHGRFMRDGAVYASRDHHAPEVWLSRVEADGSGAHPFEAVDAAGRFEAGLMTGLRLCGGVDVEALSKTSGKSFNDMVDLKKLDVAVREGWAVFDGVRLRLTREGILRLNALLPYLLV